MECALSEPHATKTGEAPATTPRETLQDNRWRMTQHIKLAFTGDRRQRMTAMARLYFLVVLEIALPWLPTGKCIPLSIIIKELSLLVKNTRPSE